MKLAFLKKFPKLYSFVVKNITYCADDFLSVDLNKQQFTKNENVSHFLIVARKHYQEKIQTYSSVSKKEVDNIVKLQKVGELSYPPIIQILPNTQQDGFDVKQIIFSDEFLASIPRNCILLPETELLTLEKSVPKVVCANTPAGELYVSEFSGTTKSAYKKGIINSVDTFAISAGIPENIQTENIDTDKFASIVINKILDADLVKIFNKASFNPASFLNLNKLHFVYWAPLASAFLFLSATYAYYGIKMSNTQEALASYGEQVDQLLSIKRTQDAQGNYLQVINQELNKYYPVHRDWNIVYEADKHGMFIQQFRKNERSILLRGRAKDASKILQALNNLEQVSSAVFQGVVRKSRGEDMFVMKLEVAE